MQKFNQDSAHEQDSVIRKDCVKRRTDGIFAGRAKVVISIFLVLLLVINLGRIGYIMVFKGDEYSAKAAQQQLYDKTLESVRGTIYDRNMTPIATSTSAWILFVNPYSIQKFFEDFPREKEAYLDALSENTAKILSMEKQDVYDALTLQSESESGEKYYKNYSVVKNKVSGNERMALEEYFANPYAFKYTYEKKSLFGKKAVTDDFEIKSGSFFGYENDSNRIYAKGNFASSVIGVVNADGLGLTGIEGYYNDTLTGEDGRVLTAKNGRNEVLESGYETVYDAKEGNGTVLTIDYEIQNYLENALSNALINIDSDGVYGIVMDVDTGAILAMSDKPDFDLNNAFQLDTNTMNTESLKNFEKGSVEYKTEYSRLLQEQWNNFCVTNTTEPGSIFKIFTGAALLEEGVANLNTGYYCKSSTRVADITYHCANNKAHGSQSFTQALMNSCNCFFITMGQQLGIETYNKYFEAFGFTERTGIDLANEAYPAYHKADKMSIVDLASTSFGQSVRVSPLQILTGACAIANGGNLMQPYLVSSIVDEEGNLVSQTEPKVRRRVISEQTASTMRSMMEAVVEGGTGKNAYIPGYRVAGKTATAEKLDAASNEDIYIASFVCFAPADDPKVAILVGVDNPKGAYRGGGVLAAPIAKEVLEPTLEYLNVERQYTSGELEAVSKTTPNLIGLGVSQAKLRASNEGLSTKVIGGGDSVISQVPAAGQNIPENGVVVIYTENNADIQKVEVPDFRGKTIREANALAASSGLNAVFSGPTDTVGVKCYSQSIAYGTSVEAGSSITIYFRSDDIVAD